MSILLYSFHLPVKLILMFTVLEELDVLEVREYPFFFSIPDRRVISLRLRGVSDMDSNSSLLDLHQVKLR